MATQAERREKTQAAIIKAAKRIFGERGFAATTMDDIAGAARVAKGAVYHHFTTKEALFAAVFEQTSLELVSDLDRISRAEKDPLAAMAAVEDLHEFPRRSLSHRPRRQRIGAMVKVFAC